MKDCCIRSYRLTTCYGLHQKTSFIGVRPHSSAHSGDSSTQRPTLPSRPSIQSFTWQGLETSSWSFSRALDRPTPQRHWIWSCQHLETDHPTGPWWSDATARAGYAMTTTRQLPPFVIMSSNQSPILKTSNRPRQDTSIKPFAKWDELKVLFTATE